MKRADEMLMLRQVIPVMKAKVQEECGEFVKHNGLEFTERNRFNKHWTWGLLNIALRTAEERLQELFDLAEKDLEVCT